MKFMTAVKEKAIDEIKKLPDAQVIYVMKIIQGINGLAQRNNSSKMRSFKRLDSIVESESEKIIDYEAELGSYRDEKYGTKNSD